MITTDERRTTDQCTIGVSKVVPACSVHSSSIASGNSGAPPSGQSAQPRRKRPQITEPVQIQERGRRLVAQLGESGHYNELLSYASKRLARLGLGCEAADLVHEAVLGVLVGLEGGPEGRHPRSSDLRDTPSFLNYLKQVIKSTATNLGRHQRCLIITSLEEFEAGNGFYDFHHGVDLTAAAQPDHDVELRDLHELMFAYLHRRAPRRLRRMIKRWKREFFWADVIQLESGHRQYRAELRSLARQALNEIESSIGSGSGTHNG